MYDSFKNFAIIAKIISRDGSDYNLRYGLFLEML